MFSMHVSDICQLEKNFQTLRFSSQPLKSIRNKSPEYNDKIQSYKIDTREICRYIFLLFSFSPASLHSIKTVVKTELSTKDTEVE